MLRLEKIRSDKTVRIKISNRLFYIIAMDGLSKEESDRLWHKLVEYMQRVLVIPDGSTLGGDEEWVDTKWFVHYLWWEHQKVSVLFITGDAIDLMEKTNTPTQELIDVLEEFEKREVKIPFCSANATEGAFTGRFDSSLSRVSLSTNDDDGEIIVNTTEEICRAAFRR